MTSEPLREPAAVGLKRTSKAALWLGWSTVPLGAAPLKAKSPPATAMAGTVRATVIWFTATKWRTALEPSSTEPKSTGAVPSGWRPAPVSTSYVSRGSTVASSRSETPSDSSGAL